MVGRRKAGSEPVALLPDRSGYVAAFTGPDGSTVVPVTRELSAPNGGVNPRVTVRSLCAIDGSYVSPKIQSEGVIREDAFESGYREVASRPTG